MAVYHDGFSCYEDLPYGDNLPPRHAIVYAGYETQDYEGSALIVFLLAGELWENNDSHCSCNGLENWGPERTTRDALLMRTGWPGLAEALDDLRVAVAAVRQKGQGQLLTG